MQLSINELLHQHQLKATGPRLNVLNIILSCDAAISQPDLEKLLVPGVDRVTLYRILNTFEDKGILHKVIDLNGTANYAMCSSSCNEHAHHDDHFHFNCTSCLKVYCMNDFQLPKVHLPSGFKAQTVNLAINGTCKNCTQATA